MTDSSPPSSITSSSSTFFGNHDDPNNETEKLTHAQPSHLNFTDFIWNHFKRNTKDTSPDPKVNSAINVIAAISIDSNHA
jgi:hypothetical protein